MCEGRVLSGETGELDLDQFIHDSEGHVDNV